jgi:hypothetical protein
VPDWALRARALATWAPSAMRREPAGASPDGPGRPSTTSSVHAGLRR